MSVQMTAFFHVTDSVCPLGRHGSPEWPKATRFLGGPGACSPGNFLK